MIDCYDYFHKTVTAWTKYYQQRFNTSNTELFYRGHSKLAYELTPTIERDRKKLPPLERNDLERDIIDAAIKSGTWNTERTLFENIAHMQHYGKSTRFLDYTTVVAMIMKLVPYGFAPMTQEI